MFGRRYRVLKKTFLNFTLHFNGFSVMIDFKHLENICQKNSAMTRSLVDEFLIYYAAQRDRLDREMEQRLARYRHITRKFQQSWVNMLKAQYIAHRIFKEDGLIKKYLNHSELQRLDAPELNYLVEQAAHPWRFSFSVVTEAPAVDFYEMEDIFTGDPFLLYSPGVTRIFDEQPVALLFNLISFNGACWQSFGPIGAYQSFEPDDIFFFATELNPQIESEEDLVADVEKNPVPYMMLLAGGTFPPIFHKNDQIVQVIAAYDQDAFDVGGLDKDFKVEYAHAVYRLTLKRWGEHPHFSTAYYDENKKVLFLSSMTDRGFSALANRLNAYGYDLWNEPDIRVNPSMLTLTQDILKKKIQLNAYDALFTVKTSEKKQEKIDKLNNLLKLLLPEINAGREPDIEAMAREAGVDVKMAREMMHQINKMRKL